MMTLVSVITGRKDFPVFNSRDKKAIFDMLCNNDFYDQEPTYEEEGFIITIDDHYEIIEVEIVDV